MKKLLFILLSIAFLTPVSAQNNTHMTFKSMPIDGSLSDFTTKMKQKGFTHLWTQDGVALFSGEFAAYKDCTIGVVSSTSTNTVCKISVRFPERETWFQLYQNYSHLKEMLTQKYGEPTLNVEKFDSSYEPEDDNSRIHELRMDRCVYVSTWETEKGDIALAIEHADYTDCFVRLIYWDKINMEKVTRSAIDDL